MRILVANLGSTSFKFRLFHLEGEAREEMLAKGGYERVTDFGAAIEQCLAELREAGHLDKPEDIDAVGFKTVHAHTVSGAVPADDRCLDALEDFSLVAPAHNPVYANGIRQFARILPSARLVALFETSFYQWAPEALREYAVPQAWREAGVRRYGFHGASHKFIAERAAQLLGREDVADRVRRLYVDGPGEFDGPPLRMVSCHLGGSSSLCAIENGLGMIASHGFSPQGGLPQNNRVGDLDSMAIPFVMKRLGLSLEEVEAHMAKESGLLGISGVSNDMRDVKAAAEQGNARARLALDVYVATLRHWLGGFAFTLGGLEALVFTAGIGENNPWLRAAVCEGLETFGLHLDPVRNENPEGEEAFLEVPGSSTRILVLPTNEELVVARETRRVVEKLAAY